MKFEYQNGLDLSIQTKLSFIHNKTTYHWDGGFGCVFYSYEKKFLNACDSRKICGVSFTPYMSKRTGLFSYKVSWQFADIKASAQDIRDFKKYIFNL